MDEIQQFAEAHVRSYASLDRFLSLWFHSLSTWPFRRTLLVYLRQWINWLTAILMDLQHAGVDTPESNSLRNALFSIYQHFKLLNKELEYDLNVGLHEQEGSNCLPRRSITFEEATARCERLGLDAVIFLQHLSLFYFFENRPFPMMISPWEPAVMSRVEEVRGLITEESECFSELMKLVSASFWKEVNRWFGLGGEMVIDAVSASDRSSGSERLNFYIGDAILRIMQRLGKLDKMWKDLNNIFQDRMTCMRFHYDRQFRTDGPLEELSSLLHRFLCFLRLVNGQLGAAVGVDSLRMVDYFLGN